MVVFYQKAVYPSVIKSHFGEELYFFFLCGTICEEGRTIPGEVTAMDERQMRELVDYYRDQGAPGDQQMVLVLLREAQEFDGGVLSHATLEAIARAYGLKQTALLALIRRIPGLRCEAAPHTLEICGTCRAGAMLRDFVERSYQVKSGGVSEAGFTYRVTPCMKNCKNGPSIKWDRRLYAKADEALIRNLIGAVKK